MLRNLLVPVLCTLPITAQVLDQYGGNTSQKCRGGAASRFYTEKIGDRWSFCTPQGNAFWLTGLYYITPASGAETRYGDASRQWSEVQVDRLRNWGFNATAEYSSVYLQPTYWSITDKLPFTGLIRPSFYSLSNYNNRAPGPVKDLLYTISDKAEIDRSIYRGWKTPDIWDPNYKAWLDGTLADDPQYNHWFKASADRRSFMIGVVVDDTDWLGGFGAGSGDSTTHFNTVANGQVYAKESPRKHPHLGWVALATSPVQHVSGMTNMLNPFQNGKLLQAINPSITPQTVTVSAKAAANAWYRFPNSSSASNYERVWVTAASATAPYTITAVFSRNHAVNEMIGHEGYSNGIVHANPVVHTKAQLQAYLKSKYATISDLNNSWGTGGFYTTFGSTAQKHVAPVATGDGVTTVFTAAVPANPVDKYSLAVKVNGVTVAGDYCYRFHSSTVEVAGGPKLQCRCDGTAAGIHGPMLRGSVASSAANACPSYVNYDTGVTRLAFATPPANGSKIIIEYTTNGWEHGRGLMDEDGSHRWIPTNLYTLKDADPQVKADLDGFLTRHAEKYFSDIQASLRKADTGCNPNEPGSCVLNLGPTYLGTWCTPALPQIIRAASRYIDAYPAYTIPCGVPDDQARLDFIWKYFGDKPIIQWDSAVSYDSPRGNTADTIRPKVATQELRGAQYAASIAAFRNARPTGSNVYPIAGTRFWGMKDSVAENMNWGLTDEFDNPYDGVCSKIGSFTELIAGKQYPCGSTRGAFGNFLSSVRTANRRWIESTSGTSSESAPCSYALSQSSYSAPIAATSGSFSVQSANGCVWTAASNASWLTITSGASGTGNGTVGFSITANAGPARSGIITVSGKTFMVSQAGTQGGSALKVAWVSDHGVCVPHGISGNGPRITQCEKETRVAAMIEKWNPDFIVATGDMSNIRGNRAETYKGILVRSANAVVGPTSTASVLLDPVTASASAQTVRVSAVTGNGYYALNFDKLNAEVIQVVARTLTPPYTITAVFLRDHAANEPIQKNSQNIRVNTAATSCDGTPCLKDLYLFGVSPQKLMLASTILGVQEDAWDKFEVIKVTAVPDSVTFTATFARSHPAGAIIRGSDHTPYLRWIKAGKFVPNAGNHDYGGGESDWCVNGTAGCTSFDVERNAFNEYWESAAAGRWGLAGKSWFAKSYGSLVSFFSLDSTNTHRKGDVQELEMTPKMNACSTRWCVTLMHHPMFGDFDARRVGGKGPDRSRYLWMANNKIDLVLSGHAHLYHRYTARNDAGRQIPYVTAGISGDSIEKTTDNACTRYGDCTVAFPAWSGNYGAGRMTITDNELKLEVFSIANPALPVDSMTLRK